MSREVKRGVKRSQIWVRWGQDGLSRVQWDKVKSDGPDAMRIGQIRSDQV